MSKQNRRVEVRISEELFEQFKEIAENDHRSVSYVAREAMKVFAADRVQAAQFVDRKIGDPR